MQRNTRYPGTPPADRVVVDDPRTMCLLGLLMRDLLARNLARDTLYEKVKHLETVVQVGAGDMTVTMQFSGGRLRITEGGTHSARARVRGSFAAMLDIVTGKGILGPVLQGRIEIAGNPLVLLKILPLIRT